MLEVFEPGTLNYFTFFRPILSTLSASRNPILTHLPLSGFSVLRSDHTHSRSGILSPAATHASGGVAIFVRQGLSFSELSTSTLSSLDPYSDCVGINISLNNFSLLSFLNVYAPLFAPFQRIAEPIPFLPSFFPTPEISSFWGTSTAITSSGTQEVLLTPVGRKYSTGLSLLTSSLSMTLTHPPFSIAPLAVAPLLTSSSLSLLVPFPAPGRCFRTWVLTAYLFFYPPLSLRPIAPTTAPSFNFQKARWDGFVSYFDFYCHSAEEYSSLSLSSAAALFTSLALNAAKSSIPFGRIKHPSKTWWSLRWEVPLVKDARLSLPLTEVMKIARLTSPLLDVPRQSSPRPKLRHGRRFALLSHLGLTLNLCTLFFALSLALFPRLPPLLIFPTVLLPGNRLHSMPII